MRFDEIRASDV